MRLKTKVEIIAFAYSLEAQSLAEAKVIEAVDIYGVRFPYTAQGEIGDDIESLKTIYQWSDAAFFLRQVNISKNGAIQ